jgi:hypothetical protein
MTRPGSLGAIRLYRSPAIQALQKDSRISIDSERILNRHQSYEGCAAVEEGLLKAEFRKPTKRVAYSSG